MCRIIGNILVTAVLVFFTVQDIRYRKIFFPAALLLGAVGLILHLFPGASITESLTGVIPGAVLLMISRFCGEAVGIGDALTLMACGAVLGFSRAFELLFIALVFSAAWSILLLIRRKGMKQTFAFMPFLLAAHICMMVR